MRPIDADALAEVLKNVASGYSRTRDTLKEKAVVCAVKLLEDEAISPTLDYAPVQKIDGNTSDGYHTFNELYHHRALLFSVIVSQFKDIAWKSKQHHDGTMFDGMFIVGVNTLQGQATYHYDIEPYWDMFDCKEVERAPEWDGHTSEQAIERIATLRLLEPFKTPVVHGYWKHEEPVKDDGQKPFVCSSCGLRHPRYGDVDKAYFFHCPWCGIPMDAETDGGESDGSH